MTQTAALASSCVICVTDDAAHDAPMTQASPPASLKTAGQRSSAPSVRAGGVVNPVCAPEVLLSALTW
ncbi:hypothetical protein, partial [Streptomyces mirabilis]|uniref:hypothetical protein n=1 Tax=Streptomyces mirabilis TaxID=68239 RepID=UPI0036D9FF96